MAGEEGVEGGAFEGGGELSVQGLSLVEISAYSMGVGRRGSALFKEILC